MANKNTTSKTTTTESMNYEAPTLEHKKCGFINEFLWTCAGVNKAVLRQCPSDYAKYAGIGGTILFTAFDGNVIRGLWQCSMSLTAHTLRLHSVSFGGY